MYDREPTGAKRNFVIAAVVAALLVVGGYWWWTSRKEPPLPLPPAPVAETPPNYAVPDSALSKEPLPELDVSDAALLDSAKELLGVQIVEQWLIPTELVRRIVVTVDNLPRKKYAERQKPVKAIPGRFAVEGVENAQVISAGNAARYAPLVQAMQGLDMGRVAQGYFHWYPLFQEAYRNLGYPDGYFNNRLVAALDDMLAAPRIAGPIAVIQPNVLYEYADPALENLSSGQKLMIRIGAENQDIVKAKLRELRAAVAAGQR